MKSASSCGEKNNPETAMKFIVLFIVVILFSLISCDAGSGQPVQGDSDQGTVLAETQAKPTPHTVDSGTEDQDIKETVPAKTEAEVAPTSANDTVTEVVSGIYSWGFEVSDFQPCGLDEKWWVVGLEPELSSRYRDITSEAYEPVYAQLKGNKSELGRYGHLGAYDRQFEVHEILELRVLQKGDCE
jgi:hypothetical protein